MSPIEPKPRKLLDQVRDVIRLKHYSYRTEKSYKLLNTHLQLLKQQHLRDLAAGYGVVHLPFALPRKYPNADREASPKDNRQWVWQYVFPSLGIAVDSRSAIAPSTV